MTDLPRQPSLRLAWRQDIRSGSLKIAPPTIRLAHVPGAQGDNILCGRNGHSIIEHEQAPALLVSYVFVKEFEKAQSNYHYRDWVMDSGAYSAHQSGVTIRLDDYIEKCKHLQAIDPSLTEVFALDVIGDWKASLRNCEKMWDAGVEAIPTYHMGSPEHALMHIAKHYPKIALGGVVGVNSRVLNKWLGQCFARVWPKRIHGFGMSGESTILGFPFHSVDATSWETGPCAFGRWKSRGGGFSVRGSNQDLRDEVMWYLDLEAKARHKWRKLLETLEG